MREIVLINITGKDKPGLTSSLTNVLAQYDVTILDIGQAVSYEQWAAEYGQQRRIITLLGRRLTAVQLSKVAAVLAANKLNIDIITRLAGHISLEHPESLPKACVQFTVSGKLDNPARLRASLPAGWLSLIWTPP